MDITKMDYLDYICEEVETVRYICFSDYLPDTHPDFIKVVDVEEVESLEELKKALLPETRIIIKQGLNTESEMIYKIYLKKTNQLPKNKLSDEVVEIISELHEQDRNEDEYQDDDNLFS